MILSLQHLHHVPTDQVVTYYDGECEISQIDKDSECTITIIQCINSLRHTSQSDQLASCCLSPTALNGSPNKVTIQLTGVLRLLLYT